MVLNPYGHCRGTFITSMSAAYYPGLTVKLSSILLDPVALRNHISDTLLERNGTSDIEAHQMYLVAPHLQTGRSVRIRLLNLSKPYLSQSCGSVRSPGLQESTPWPPPHFHDAGALNEFISDSYDVSLYLIIDVCAHRNPGLWI